MRTVVQYSKLSEEERISELEKIAHNFILKEYSVRIDKHRVIVEGRHSLIAIIEFEYFDNADRLLLSFQTQREDRKFDSSFDISFVAEVAEFFNNLYKSNKDKFDNEIPIPKSFVD